MASTNHPDDRSLEDEAARLHNKVATLETALRVQTARAEALVAEAEQFRAVAECTYDVECWLGRDGCLVWINPAIERLTGYSVAECLGMTEFPAEMVGEEDRDRIRGAFRQSGQADTGNDVPFQIRTKKGESVWVSVSWQPMHAADGRYLGRRASIRDIRDRKAAEDRLVQQRKLLSGLLANIPSGVYWKARDYRYEGCNEAFARSAGVERPEDIIGRTDYELAWDAEQADYFRACDRQVMEENRPMYNIQELERQADGRQAVLLTSKVPLQDAEGQVWGLLGIDTDISELKRVEAELREIKVELESRVLERTAALADANQQLEVEVAERIRAEEALRLSQERYRLVSELTSDYAYALAASESGEWRVEWVSEAFARIAGNQEVRLDPGGGWANRVHPDDAAILAQRWETLQAGRSVTTEFRVVAGPGRHRWLRDHARPLLDDASRRVTRILGAAQDITERKQAEEEARRHQEALAHVARLSTMGELTGQLAHELNQPLCTVVGNAQTAQRLLASPTPDVPELRAALGDIVAAGKHAGEVIRRLRELVRREQPRPALLNPLRLMAEVSGFIDADARRHGVTVRFEMPDSLPLVRGDSIQLQQVILNLVRNGMEAMSSAEAEDRELTVRLEIGGGRVVIRVADRGPGLTDEAAGLAFEPFYTTKPGGLGLGLSISRSIAEAHGGQLWAEANPGGGTRFTLALPVIREEVAP